MYSCEECGFYTTYISNYNKHVKTDKHKRNIKKSPFPNKDIQNLNDSEDIVNDSGYFVNNSGKFVCNFCKKQFEHKTSLYRHRKHRCRINPDSDYNKNKKIEDLEAEPDIYVEPESEPEVTKNDKLTKEIFRLKEENLKLIIEKNEFKHALELEKIKSSAEHEKYVTECFSSNKKYWALSNDKDKEIKELKEELTEKDMKIEKLTKLLNEKKDFYAN